MALGETLSTGLSRSFYFYPYIPTLSRFLDHAFGKTKGSVNGMESVALVLSACLQPIPGYLCYSVTISTTHPYHQSTQHLPAPTHSATTCATEPMRLPLQLRLQLPLRPPLQLLLQLPLQLSLSLLQKPSPRPLNHAWLPPVPRWHFSPAFICYQACLLAANLSHCYLLSKTLHANIGHRPTEPCAWAVCPASGRGHLALAGGWGGAFFFRFWQ